MIIETEVHQNYSSHLGYITFLKYYAVRYPVDNNYVNNRKVIFDFKGGLINRQIDSLFIEEIQKVKVKYPNCPFWLSPIPASTVVKHQIRFEKFINRISQASNINNGYSLVGALKDRPEVHTSGTRDHSLLLESSSFGDVKKKNIILCDDVSTKGVSFNILANHLRSLGAAYVIGIILGQTHWLEE